VKVKFVFGKTITVTRAVTLLTADDGEYRGDAGDDFDKDVLKEKHDTPVVSHYIFVESYRRFD
jgi:hypothetical protein